jgi:hypothetical protein
VTAVSGGVGLRLAVYITWRKRRERGEGYRPGRRPPRDYAWEATRCAGSAALSSKASAMSS